MNVHTLSLSENTEQLEMYPCYEFCYYIPQAVQSEKRNFLGGIAEGAPHSQGEAGWAGPAVASQPEVIRCRPQRGQRMLSRELRWGTASRWIQPMEKKQQEISQQ